jgi:predicted AlkP superfamily phosphohydrolase/phosphomutase
MSDPTPRKPSRRTFLKRSAVVAGVGAAAAAGGYWLGRSRRAPCTVGKKVIVIGVDGMDPRLCADMMAEGKLPHLARMRAAGGFSPLGTSIPPQSPVAWANFINGAGPGSHGIFEFIHRHPHEQCSKPFYAAAETVGGATHLRRQGTPFWEHLDAAGAPSTFYDLPSNYPPSPSAHGHHRCLCGMGTPDMLGTYGTYQHFADPPLENVREDSGKHFALAFEGETARASLVGPRNDFIKEPRPYAVDFLVHRDRQADAAVIDIQGQRLVLKAGQWSRWVKLAFEAPWYQSDVSGLCRFYLQEVAPHFRLYVSPINMDPSAPAQKMSEPESFVKGLAGRLGPFATVGFQEEYSARKNEVFDDDEFRRQADMVLKERLALFERAVDDYDDGLLFFYFSSSDLQSHMFWWWGPDGQGPNGLKPMVGKHFGHVRALYQKLDTVVGDLLDRFGASATLFVMSDHGFANFGRQFNLNSWLRDHGYLQTRGLSSVREDIDWSTTVAYGLGINGLYLNLKGRERDGGVEPKDAEEKLQEIKERLEKEVPEEYGERPIRTVYRADEVYTGGATALAPDLIVGYARGYRASWATCLGELTPEVLSDNDLAWRADHCADALEVPGVLFCNRPFRRWWRQGPALVDLAPSILAEFGLPASSEMTGRSIFA